MLRSLHIENYVLIDSLDVDFPEGLVIITGQTGAGKSILLGAMSLLLGAKPDASHISSGADSCVVEACFEVGDNGELCSLLEENDVEWDDGRLLVRRVLHRSGRTRSFINDCPVAAQVISSISPRLVDIHSQHQSLLLTDNRYQLSMLDAFAGLSATVDGCRSLWAEMKSAENALNEMRALSERTAFDAEYDAARLAELDRAGLREGELEDLEEEQKILSNAGEIKTTLSQVCGLRPDQSVKDAVRALTKVSRYMPSLEGLASRIDSARIEMADVFDELESLAESTEVSEERLAQVEERLSLLYGLMKKHGCRTVPELISCRDALSEKVAGYGSADERILELEEKVAKLKASYRSVCTELSAGRAEAAPRFASGIRDLLTGLEMDRAVFEVDIRNDLEGPSGADSVKFLFSSTGSNPVDVSKCASGGEISRIMLCLKSVMARYAGMPTLVFDEIDTGVSGSVADKMGEMICSMGNFMQVIAITHLPQVAAKGDAHFVVSKEILSDGTAKSGIARVDGEERVREIARLLSGSRITPEAVANAEALIIGR